MRRVKVLSLLLALILAISLLAGCGGGDSGGQNESGTETNDETTSQEETNGNTGGAANDVLSVLSDPNLKDPYGLPNFVSDYPLKGNPTLTWWWPLDGFQVIGCKDMNQQEVWKYIQEVTGVTIEFIHPAVGQESEQFNLMISSGELPDMICQSDRYKGGITAGIEDGVYLDLKDVIDQYCPNYKQVRESTDLKRKTTSDNAGHVLAFYNLEPYPEWQWYGPIIKKEALEKTGMEEPTTMSEWYTFLKKCKEAGYDIPYLLGTNYGTEWSGLFCSAYESYDWMFVDENGKAAFGPIQPGTKQYLAEMNKWYKEGLIDKEWATRPYDQKLALMSSDDVAAITESPDTMWGILKEEHGIDFVGALYPVLNEGEKPKSTQQHWENEGWPTSITTQCDNVEAAAKFLDFGYSKVGWRLYNWGLPETTHKINDEGMPYYHEESAMWAKDDPIPLANRVWEHKIHNGPFIRDEHNSNPLIVMPGSYSGEIRQRWQENHDFSRAMPPVYSSLTEAEASEEAKLAADISTLRNETFAKIINGELPLSAFDTFVEQAKQMGVDRLVELWQIALDRFNAR